MMLSYYFNLSLHYYFLILCTAAPPKIYRRNNQAVARFQKEEDKETQVSCSVEKSNPLPTFKWDYQAINCPELDNNCKPLEDQWNLVPLGLLTSPAAKQTNKSIIRVESGQGNTFYRCQANNSLGNDSYLIMFVRVGKKVMQPFPFLLLILFMLFYLCLWCTSTLILCCLGTSYYGLTPFLLNH